MVYVGSKGYKCKQEHCKTEDKISRERWSVLSIDDVLSIHVLCSLHADSSNKSGIAHTFHAMALHSPDSAKKVASEILPLVFLAMHAKAKEDGMHIIMLANSNSSCDSFLPVSASVFGYG